MRCSRPSLVRSGPFLVRRNAASEEDCQCGRRMKRIIGVAPDVRIDEQSVHYEFSSPGRDDVPGQAGRQAT